MGSSLRPIMSYLRETGFLPPPEELPLAPEATRTAAAGARAPGG